MHALITDLPKSKDFCSGEKLNSPELVNRNLLKKDSNNYYKKR